MDSRLNLQNSKMLQIGDFGAPSHLQNSKNPIGFGVWRGNLEAPSLKGTGRPGLMAGPLVRK